MDTRTPEGAPSSDGEDDDESSVASIDVLANLLRSVVRTGIDQTREPPRPELLALACVQARARESGYPDTEDGRRLALRDVIGDALDALGDGPYPAVARLLLGADVVTRGRTLAERRRIAADALDVLPTTFRKNHEAALVHNIAAEIFRAETAVANGGQQATITEPATEPAVAPGGSGPDGSVPAVVVEAEPAPAAELEPAGGFRALAWWRPVGKPLGVRSPTRRRTSGPDRVLFVGVVAALVWRRWGLDPALMWVAFPALVVHGLRVLVEMSTGFVAWVDALPRFSLVVILLAVITSRLWFGSDSDEPDVPNCEIQHGYSPQKNADGDYECVQLNPEDDDGEPEGVDVESFPHYTPPTYAEVPDEPASATCPPDEPPDDPSERRLLFESQPPLCIDPDQDYVATVVTNFGGFEINLDPEIAPWGVNAFVFLAEWGYYDGITINGTRGAESEATLDKFEFPVLANDWLLFGSPYEHEPDFDRAGFQLVAEPFEEDYETRSLTAPIYVILPATVYPETGEATGYVDPTQPTLAMSDIALEDLNGNTRFPDTLIGEAVELSQPDRRESCPTRDEGYRCLSEVLTRTTGDGRIGRSTFEVPIVIDSITIEGPDDRDDRRDREDVQAELDDVEQELADLEDEFDEQLNPPWPEEPADRDDLDWDRFNELTEEREELLDALNT